MKIKINIQSESDLITNSASEIFCAISSLSEDSIKMVQEYLNSFLPDGVEYFVHSQNRIAKKRIYSYLNQYLESREPAPKKPKM